MVLLEWNLTYLAKKKKHGESSQQQELCASFSGEDVKAALFDIDEGKAVGPDGYSSGFFRKAWSCVGNDIVAAVLDFFQTWRLLKQINATTLCLIPKVEQPEDVSHFRPIACYNMLYKVISKMLDNMLKVVLPCLVDQIQSAFVENRIIMHNIVICQDILNHYKRKSEPPRCTIWKIILGKLTILSVNWGFLGELLKKLHFPDQFRGWIMTCVTSLTYIFYKYKWRVVWFFQG